MSAVSGLALLQCLRLASPALPIGAYSYSQGLESAIEHGWVSDAASARAWIADQIAGPLTHWEGPLLWRALLAVEAEDMEALTDLNAQWLASRESRELHAETVQTGYSLRQLLLATGETQPLPALPALPCVWARAAASWGVPPEAALHAWGWSWLENQVMVLMKALPLGQTAGQQIIADLLVELEAAIQIARQLPDDELSSFVPGLAWLSAQHETQYSRLFRS